MSTPRLLTATGGARPGRSARERYGFAVLAALIGVGGDLVLGFVVSEAPLYAILVGVVVVSAAYGGIGPGLLTTALAWFLGLWLLVEPRGELRIDGVGQVTRWGAALAVALLLLLLMEVLRKERQRAATAVEAAEETIRGLSALQDLAAACSAALSQDDVARALVERLPRLLGAHGGALALVDGGALVVVDPGTDAVQTHRPGTRIPLTARAPIARAASGGDAVVVRSRSEFETTYPDGVRLTSYARAGVAAPVRVGGEVVGAISFLYDDEGAMFDDAEALARIAADLGGQALERAGFYEREYESRQALDRILRMSPTFHADTPEAVTRAICREARMAFGADLGMVWRFHGPALELLRSDPVLEPLEPGLVAMLEEFPDLLDAVGNLQVSFVQDVQREATGEGLERVRGLGLRSSLRLPVVVAGSAEHLITISWETVVTEPDPPTMVLARRFADQAGLAFEQLERRRAEAEAMTYADETRRLQEVASALSLAASATDVGDTCLEHALSAIGADAGFLTVSRGPGARPEIVSSVGLTEEELGAWGAYDLDADVPASRTFASGAPVWALTSGEMAAFGDAVRGADEGWVALPLSTSGGVRAVLQLSFHRPRELSEGEQRWLIAVVSQCAQALERSLLFDEEQRLRERSERLQAMTAALSNAVTRVDVAEVVVDALTGALDADAAALAIVQADRGLLRTLASRGEVEAAAWDRTLETELDADLPGPNALRRRVPDFFASRQELEEAFPGLGAHELAGHASFFFVPLVAGGRANGLLTVSWVDSRALSADERRFALLVAGNAAHALDRAGTFEAEQTIAATLQRSVLPSTLPRVEGVQIAARYLPGTLDLNVGGDWFDAIALSDGRLGLVVGDVVGKGVQAAATMAQLRNGLRAFSLDRMKPSSTVARLDRLAEEVLETAFATMLYAVVDTQALVCRYTSAGHPPAVVAHADGRVELLEGGRGLPLGTGAGARYGQAVVELTAGSVLVLYTDGLVERRGSSIDAGLERLQAAIDDGPRDPEPLLEHILERMVVAGERDDDIALLAARVFALAPRPLELRVPGDVGSLEVVRDALRAWLEGTPADRAESEQIVLAVWETCANAVEHGRADGGRDLSVRATVDEHRVEVVVEDAGRWKEPVDVPDRGLGLKLIEAVTSSVDVEARETGTRVTIEKALAGDDAGEPSAAG